MELDITEFFNEESPADYSASVAELGQDAGKITWGYAQEAPYTFVTEENAYEVREYFDSFGAWEDLDDWPLNDLNALLIQDISAQIREATDENGEIDLNASGTNICQGDDAKIYIYLGM